MLLKIPAADRLDIDYRLLVPLLLHSTIFQIVISTARVTTTYRALELGLSVVWLGVISATFALLPVVLAVSVGRFIDRGNDALAAWIGSTILVMACLGLTFSGSAEVLLAFNAMLGISHLFLMASQQMLCVRAGGARGREQVFGNYMVAASIGQGLGPYVVGWIGGSASIPPTQRLFVVALIGAAVTLACALAMRREPPNPRQTAEARVVPVRELLGVPGLGAVLLTSFTSVTAGDLIVIYLPLIGAERGMDVSAVGLLLATRAASSMVARLLYTRILMMVGRGRLLVVSTFAGALSFAFLAVPLPHAAAYVAMAAMGVSLGIASTLSITSVVELAAPGARGTVNSLRIMGNRVGQAVLPFTAGLIAAATGAAGILVMIALGLLGSSAAVRWSRAGQAGSDAGEVRAAD